MTETQTSRPAWLQSIADYDGLFDALAATLPPIVTFPCPDWCDRQHLGGYQPEDSRDGRPINASFTHEMSISGRVHVFRADVVHADGTITAGETLVGTNDVEDEHSAEAALDLALELSQAAAVVRRSA